MMSRGSFLPQLYDALLRMSLLRDEVHAVADDLGDTEVAHYLARIHDLEAQAVRLLDHVEMSALVNH